MRTSLALLGLAVLAGCSANVIKFADATSSSGAGGSTGSATTGSTGAGGATTGSTGAGGATAVGATTGASTGGATTGSASAGTSSASTGSASSGGPGPDAGSMMPPAEVYGQSPTTLYKLDPVTKVMTTVGDFVGCDTVIDIALDKGGNMFATTFTGFYSVNKANAVCKLIAEGAYPNSLSFVPEGTLDPNVEALVGYNGAQYVRIDLITGAVSDVGSLGNQGYVSSGDVVSVIGGGTYLTVQGGPSNCADCIVQVDPKTGALMNFIGPVGHADVYGLAFWAGSAYGFDDTGELFEINLTNGASTTIPIPNAPPGLIFYGAGSTTSAPISAQ